MNNKYAQKGGEKKQKEAKFTNRLGWAERLVRVHAFSHWRPYFAVDRRKFAQNFYESALKRGQNRVRIQQNREAKASFFKEPQHIYNTGGYKLQVTWDNKNKDHGAVFRVDVVREGWDKNWGGEESELIFGLYEVKMPNPGQNPVV